MSMSNSYIKSLELALNRNPVSDTFVIRRTVSYIEKVLQDLKESDPSTIEKINKILTEYLNSDVHFEITMDSLFGDKDLLQRSVYQFNMSKIRMLKEKIDLM